MKSQHRQLEGTSNLKFLILILQCALGATFTSDTLHFDKECFYLKTKSHGS